MDDPIVEFTKERFSHMIHDVKGLNRQYMDQIRSGSLVYEELRSILKYYLNDILKKLTPLKEFESNNRVTKENILQILHFVPGMIPRLNMCSKNTSKKSSYKIRSKYTKLMSESSKLNKQLRDIRNKDNKNLLEELNTKLDSLYEQIDEIKNEYLEPALESRVELQEKLKEQSSCFYFYPKTVHDLIDYLVRENGFNLTFTDDAYLLLQFDLEYFLKKLILNAINATYHSKRNTIMPKDLQISQTAMRAYEKIIRKPRFVYPKNYISYKSEYIKIRDTINIKEKTVNKNLILQLDTFNHLLIDLLIEYAHVYSIMEKGSKITKRNLQIAVKSIFPDELTKYALNEGEKPEQNSNKPIFNVKTGFTLEEDAAVFLNRVVEYINVEMIELMDGLHSISKFSSMFEEDDELDMLKNHLGFVIIKMT